MAHNILATTEGTHGGPKNYYVIYDDERPMDARYGVGSRFAGANMTVEWYATREAAFQECGKLVARSARLGRLRGLRGGRR